METNGLVGPRETTLARALKVLTAQVTKVGREPESPRGDPLLCHQCGEDRRTTRWVLYTTGGISCHLFCDNDCLSRWLRAQELLTTEELIKEHGFDPR
jgi:hypothetical protein